MYVFVCLGSLVQEAHFHAIFHDNGEIAIVSCYPVVSSANWNTIYFEIKYMIFTYVQTSNHEIIKSGGDQIFNQCFRFVIRINDKSSPKIRYYYGNNLPLFYFKMIVLFPNLKISKLLFLFEPIPNYCLLGLTPINCLVVNSYLGKRRNVSTHAPMDEN